jgi:hypothetical protein
LNTAILHPKVQEFITDHLKSNITKMILTGSPFIDVSVQELAEQIISKLKSEHKIPSWFSNKNIYYPPKVSIEQSSSEITANYKSKLIKGDTIIDITGGFGVDCFYFSKRFKKVIHCEINTHLSTIVKHNYKQLNIRNIVIFSGNGIEYLKNYKETYSCIYLDPSRRDERKGKVFLLKDCIPNVPEHIDFLFSKTNQILIKNSPILDLTSAINELKFVKEIHIVAIQNEVKELLFLLEKGYDKSIRIETVNNSPKKIQSFNFNYKEEATSIYSKPLTYLYEPNSAILKSGGFHQICNQLEVFKIHEHSHIFTSKKIIDFPGRIFKIELILPYQKKKIKNLLKNNKANITTRNFPKTVDQIRKETKIKEGGDSYLFFTKINTDQLAVLFCKKAEYSEV